MIMEKISQIMDEYFRTVSDEQFEKDLIKAGILRCPDKVTFEIPAETLRYAGNQTDNYDNLVKLSSTLSYDLSALYHFKSGDQFLDREVV